MKRKGYLFLWGIFGLKIKMACELSAKINLLITGCIHPIFNGCTTTTACRVANTYTLTEADGFPGFNYVNSFYQFPSGKIYAKDIVGNFHITGNNFVATIPALNGLENSASVVRTGENEVWFADQKKVFIIKGDSVYKTIPFPSFKHIVSTKLLGKNIYLFRQVKDSISIYTLKITNGS